jgi:metal-dependent amidase/aminoacylase/carboxypeptidase family protein
MFRRSTGAAAMIRDGAFASPKPDMVFGLHNHPEYPAGSIAVKKGPLMAAVNTLRHDLPPVLNHPEATRLVRERARVFFGPNEVVVPTPSMGGEDFALFQEQIPGCFFWLGVGQSGSWRDPSLAHPPPSSGRSFPFGASVLALAAWNALEKSA